MNNQFNFLKALSSFKDKKILVIGDVGLDEYVTGEVKRISPEAPVPILDISNQFSRLGLASNVAANISSLGGQAFLIGVIGNDDTGHKLKRELEKYCSSDYLIIDNYRPTTKKIRAMNDQHHMFRMDQESRESINSEIENEIITITNKLIPTVDAVILEDYGKGLLTKRVLQSVISEAKRNKKLITLDPHISKRSYMYTGVDYITPNSEEAFQLSGEKKIENAGEWLLERLESKAVIVTRGKDGMSIFEEDRQTDIKTAAQKVFDVTGAGDTVIAALSLGLTSGLLVEEACLLANQAAGLVVGKIGTSTVTNEELKEMINEKR